MCPKPGTVYILTLKVLSKIVTDNILSSFFFSGKIKLVISCESCARQITHMKCQALFSVKKKIEMSSSAHVITTLKTK